VILAASLAGVGLYANAQGDPISIEALPGDEFLAPVTCGPALGRGLRVCAPSDPYEFCSNPLGEPEDDARCPAVPLRAGAAPWWWAGAGAVLVLGLAALPLAGRRRSV
jgi:hypothetical protein